MSCTAPQTWSWQHRRLWYQISSHPLLSQFIRGQSGTATATALANIRMQCSLQRPALSYLLQHSVCGQALVAPTVLLEMAAAAGQLLWSQEEINNPVALTALVIKQPALLLDGTVNPTLNCDISPASGGIIVGSGILPSGEAAAHIHGRLQGIDTAVTRLEVDVLSVDAWLLESQGANRATNLPPHGPTDLNGMASLFNPTDRKRTWALFGSVCVKEHRNSSCWIHPAVADASLQLNATVASQSQIRSVGGAVLAACGAYAPMRRLAASSAAVGAAVMQDGGSSNTWLLSLRQQLLATLGNQFKALKAAETPSPSSGAVSPCGLPAISNVCRPPPIANLDGITQQLSEIVAHILGTDGVPADQPLMDAGLDSTGKL